MATMKHGCQPLPRARRMENGIPLLSDIGGTEAGLVCSAGCVHRGGSGRPRWSQDNRA